MFRFSRFGLLCSLRSVSPWRAPIFGLIAAIICLAIAPHAFAQAVATAAPATGADIPLAPFVTIFQQTILAFGVTLAGILATWLAKRLAALLHVKMTETQETRLSNAAKTAAGSIIAAGEAGISTEVIHVNDQRIAGAVNALPAKAKDLATALGYSDANLAKLVQGEVGKLQAIAPQTPAPPAPAPK